MILPVILIGASLALNEDVEFSFEDPNAPGSITSYTVYRSSDASLPSASWQLLAVGVTDEDTGRPFVQWTDTDASLSPTNTWYYEIVASNDHCPLGSSEGPW